MDSAKDWRGDAAARPGRPGEPGSDPEDEMTRPELDDPSAGDPEDEMTRPELDDPDLVTATNTSTRTRRFEVRRRAVRAAAAEECYSGFIIVRLTGKLARRDEDCGCDEHARGLGKSRRRRKRPSTGRGGDTFPKLWEKFPELCQDRPPVEPAEPEGHPCCRVPVLLALEWLRELVRVCPPVRVVRVLAPEAIFLVEELAAREGLAPLHGLGAYWRLDARHLPESIVRAVVRLLNEFPEVDLAYRELAALDPAVAGGTPRFDDLQQYRERAPLGIDARWAWKRANELGPAGEAPSVVVADLEQGWFEHEDLPGPSAPVHGVNRHGRDDYRGDHGTAVVGQLAAADDGRGVVGIAPGLRVLRLSHFQEGGEGSAASNGHVADAVVAALLELSFAPDVARRLRDGDVGGLELTRRHLRSRGDVLLLEVQRSFKPAEVDHADFDAVRLATALGVIVVEAAGNGNAGLDAYRDETGRRILDPAHPDFRDSGALLVGAAESALPHDRAASSNFGSRIDCFAWGDGVVTCGYGDLYAGATGRNGERRTYTRSFKGTSAASPIIAGAAVLVQWMSERTGGRLGPAEIRRALSNPATGTPQGGGVGGRIGVMPDLRAVVRELGLAPDFSPGRALGADPPAAFAAPHVRIETRNHTTTLELANQGLPVAKRPDEPSNLTVDLYWSELSTLATPDMWTRIEDSLTFNEDFPTGMPVELPVAAEKLPTALRRVESKSFLALPRVTGEPALALPPGPPYFQWDAFLAFLRRHRSHVTLVLDLDDPPPAELELPFLVSGAPGGPRAFDFEIHQRLPMGAEVALQVPVALSAELASSRLRRQGERFFLPARPRVVLRRLRLAAAGSWSDRDERSIGRYACSFLVRRPGAGLAVTVRQLYGCEELGRIRWELRIPEEG